MSTKTKKTLRYTESAGGEMKCCKTCKWSRWSLTPSGRIQRDTTGQCAVPLPDLRLILPISVTTAYGFVPPSRRYIGPLEGVDCPLYEETVVELRAIGFRQS